MFEKYRVHVQAKLLKVLMSKSNYTLLHTHTKDCVVSTRFKISYFMYTVCRSKL